MTYSIAAEEDFAHLHLQINEKEREPRHYRFSIMHLPMAMTIHNFICAKNDTREPELYLVSNTGRELLNNRLEFERAKRDMMAARQNPGIVMPGIYGPDF